MKLKSIWDDGDTREGATEMTDYSQAAIDVALAMIEEAHEEAAAWPVIAAGLLRRSYRGGIRLNRCP